MRELEGRVAVITGAASGIGRGMARAFADAGARLVLADIDTERLGSVVSQLEAGGTPCLGIPTDVSVRAELEALAERAYREFGAVHVLCNNAGVFLPGPLTQTREEDWRWLLGVNLHGVIHGLQAFLPRLLAQHDEAHIVNTGSLCSLAVYPGYGIYTTSKFALAGLTEALRIDLATRGIGVSLLCPGEVQTALTTSLRSRPAELGGSSLDEAEATGPRGQILEATARALEEGLDPLAVGRCVVSGVRRNQAYIVTHPEAKPQIEERAQRVLSAFDDAAQPTIETAPSTTEELRGQVATVTGAGSGIGRGIALAFAERGMHVALLDIELPAAEKVAAEVRSRGVRALPLRVDVSRSEELEQAARAVYAELGATHVLCNNAGVFLSGLSQERTDEDYRWVLSVNLYGVIHGLQAFLPRMLKQGDARHVVNTASIVGLMFGPSSGIYATSKHAVVGLSESLAQDLEPYGIGVSVLCPGGVRTRIMDSRRNRPAALSATHADARTDRIARDAIEAGLDPLEVGRCVVEGVLAGRLHILPQPEARPFAEQRFKEILAAFDEGPPSQELVSSSSAPLGS